MQAIKELANAISAVDSDVIGQIAQLCLHGSQRPWVRTGVAIAAGQAYSLFASGRIDWSARYPELYAGPGFHLWARVSPAGRIVNVTRNSGSFQADVAGEIELGIYLGMWTDEFGALETPASAYRKMAGELEIVLVKWRGTAALGVKALATRITHPILAAEAARLDAAVAVPAGWEYLYEIGTTDVFRDCSGARASRICLDATDDQGIIAKPVEFRLNEATTLSWRWRLQCHPSTVAEDSVRTHDYVSVAAEFDNGRDLTWIWSSELPLETWFDCPIKAWARRETHYVVRSREAALGHWYSEQRQVFFDVERAMGAPPSRIVRIWLIAVASFQHGRAQAAFENIQLQNGTRTLHVL